MGVKVATINPLNFRIICYYVLHIYNTNNYPQKGKRFVQKSRASDVPNTSCRHQIKDDTGRIALHPAEILYEALKD